MLNKESQPTKDPLNPQTFALRFIERNFERREIDEESFRSFNKFVMMVGKELSKNTSKNDVEGFIIMVNSVQENFDELNKGLQTFSLYIQLLEICMQVFESAIALKLPKDICCEFINIFWPIWSTDLKEFPFAKAEEKLMKIKMPKELEEQEGMIKVNEFEALPQLISSNKYESLISESLVEVSGSNVLQSVLISFLRVEGENYLDIILETLVKCFEEQDLANFKKILKVFLTIGDTSSVQIRNMSVLLPKILSHKNKLEFLNEAFESLVLVKNCSPEYLFLVCVTTLDSIFTDRIINNKTINLLKQIGSYLNVFKQLDKIGEEQEALFSLYNKVLTVLFYGKSSQELVCLPDVKLQKFKSGQPKKELDKDAFLPLPEISPKVNKKESIEEELIKKTEKFEALTNDEIQTISILMRKFFTGLMSHKKTKTILNKVYTDEKRVKEVIQILSENTSSIKPECLQLILTVYVPLFEEIPSFKLSTTNIDDESALIKVIKLRILERNIENKEIANDELFKTYYKNIHERLVSEKGTNFDFLALTVLHEHISSARLLIEYLVDSCLKKIEQKDPQKSNYFRCNIALLASLFDLHHNIIIKLSPIKLKSQISKLNCAFSVQDFISVSELKENKLFVTGPKIELCQEKEDQLDLMGEFITKLFTTSETLAALINISNSSEENWYYYMILIELCTACMKKVPQIGSESEEIQSIIKIRKNNKYSLPITIANELLSAIKSTFEQEPIKQGSLAIILHLLIKFEIAITEPNQLDKEVENLINDSEKELGTEKLQEIQNSIFALIKKIGEFPNFEILKLICKGFDVREDLSFNQQLINFSMDQTEAKKNKLKEFIKNFQIIKYFSEAVNNNESLIVILIRIGMKIIAKNQNVLPETNNIRPFNLLYDPKAENVDEKNKRNIEVYIKMRLIATQQNCGGKLTNEESKKILKFLEENHETVKNLIINEENNEESTEVERLFGTKTKFIEHLLDQIINVQNETQSECRVIVLNLFATLVQNHTSVMEVSKKYISQILENSDALPKLILNRVEKSISHLKDTELKIESGNKTEANTKSQKTTIEELEKILEESKKIYEIISKILGSIGEMKSEDEHKISEIVSQLINLDDYSNIQLSIYIVREIINISPILNKLLTPKSQEDLSEKLFSYLMAIREIYCDVVINLEDDITFNVSTLISFFVQRFYGDKIESENSIKLSDKFVQSAITENSKANGQLKLKEKSTCLNSIHQKKGSYKCLKCDVSREFCINCAIACHKDHPVIYVQPNMRVSKNCQCSEEICKINPIFEKNKEKRKERIKEPSFLKGNLRGGYGTYGTFDDDIEDRILNSIDYPDEDWPIQESYNYSLDYRPQANPGVTFTYTMPPNPMYSIPPPLPRREQGRINLPQAAQLVPNQNQNPNPNASMMGGLGGVSGMGGMGGMGSMGSVNPPSSYLPNIFSALSRDGNPDGFLSSIRTGSRNSYQNVGDYGRISDNDYELILRKREEKLRERERDRDRREKEFFKERERKNIRGGDRDLGRNYPNEVKYESKYSILEMQERDKFNRKLEAENPQEIVEEEEPNDTYQEENYELSLLNIKQKLIQLKQSNYIQNQQVYEQTIQQSYLLPIFMGMAIEICEKKKEIFKEAEPEISWHIKLTNPPIMSSNIVNGQYSICGPKTFNTRLPKSEGSYHPSPYVSRTPFAVSDKFVFILSGPKVSIHLRELLYSFLMAPTLSGYPSIFELALHFEPHSVSVGYKNFILVAGLHNIIIHEYDSNGKFCSLDKQLRFNFNNDNVNKVKLTKFGVFVGVSRAIHLLSHTLQPKISFKIPDALIKEWCILETGPDSYSLYVTTSEGYIMFADGNINSSSDVQLTKSINDSRTNRPVGAFVLAKKIESCGTMVLCSYKDKSIGHSLGRLTGESSLADINYIKLNSQGIDPIFEKYNLMGVSDIAPNWEVSKEDGSKSMFISTVFSPQTNDIMSIHRGLLGIIKIKQDENTGFSKYEIQTLCNENERCDYFEIVWFEDKKHWFILSIHEDGSLHVIVPNKINKNVIEKELLSLKDKKKNERSEQNDLKKDNIGDKKNDKNDEYELLAKNIKQNLNANVIQKLITDQNLSGNEFLAFLENSDSLKSKEDYTITLLSNHQETKSYEIKLLNKKKVITGLFFSQLSNVSLPTRKLENVFDVGFTLEESLYFYAFGTFRIEVKKADDSTYSRDFKKKLPPGKIREDFLFEEKVLQNLATASLKTNSEVSVYGEVFDSTFKARVGELMKKFEEKELNESPFCLSGEENIENCLKTIDIFLTNSISTKNEIVSREETEPFVEVIRNSLLSKTKINKKLSLTVKSVIYKSLKLLETLENKKSHVFNDVYHPLRFSTETIIEKLYESLSKGEINDEDTIVLVNELYNLVSETGESEMTQMQNESEFDVLLYYIAKYPSMIYKLHKKVKILESNELMYQLIPLYVLGYQVLNFLEYHLEWLLPALCEIVGKCFLISGESIAKPSYLNRLIFYKFLKISQSLKLPAWIKNVEGVDTHECMKDVPAILNKPSINNNNNLGVGGGGFGGLDFGLIYGAQDDLDEEAMFQRAIKLSELESKLADQMPEEEEEEAQIEQEQMMEEEIGEVNNFNKVSTFIKELVHECLQQIDYSVTNIEDSCQKAIVIYVLLEFALYNNREDVEGSKEIYEYLCSSIHNVIQKLCLNYHEITNNNTHNILMLWLNLFGIVYRDSSTTTIAQQKYDEAKNEIILVLNKFKIENVKRFNFVPNLFVRRIKGSKITTKANFIYGFISVLQKPCEANFVLLTLGCYWLFAFPKEYYTKIKYIETIRENEKMGNIQKIYETALTDLQTWKEIGNPEWLEKWVEEQKDDWPEVIELLSLYYE